MTALAGGPTLGLAEAAKVCGVSVSTLRRKRPDLEANGAVQTDKGWRIPVTALIALDLMSRTTDAPHETHHETPVTPAMTPPLDALSEELDALRSKLAAAEQRAAVAEAVAAERERLIQSQAMALRMLGAGASEPREEAHDSRQENVPDTQLAKPEPRPTLWSRITGARRQQSS